MFQPLCGLPEAVKIHKNQNYKGYVSYRGSD